MDTGSGTISWRSVVMIEQNFWDDLPQYAVIPDPASLPDTVSDWLSSTDCCQLNAPSVNAAIQEVGNGIEDIIELADTVESYVMNIPWEFPHNPISFDAEYAIKWGNSCTGHAHSAAALFRGNGVPSRALLNIPTFLDSTNWFDQHWIVDYYIPDYGWVMAESGNPSVNAHKFIVTYVNQTYHEFTKWYDHSIDALWHSSDPFLFGPNWGVSHRGYEMSNFLVNQTILDEVMVLGAELWDLHTTCTGLILTSPEAALRVQATASMNLAFEAINNEDIDSYIANTENAISAYQSIFIGEVETPFFENFEGGTAGWTHGGEGDSWEHGTPSSGPVSAYSGASCWATNLSGNYASNSECWLLSPPVSLDNISCAELSFWLWNDTEDLGSVTWDYLFVEVSPSGEDDFIPLSYKLVGVNNDPEITAVGGWTKIILDLRRYITEQVQFRFTFSSNGQNTFTGAYIDDVTVRGRSKDLTNISAGDSVTAASLGCSPNPCSFSTSIHVNMPRAGSAIISVFDLSGRRIAVPSREELAAGYNSLPWDCTSENGERLPAGIYVIRVDSETQHIASKVVITSR